MMPTLTAIPQGCAFNPRCALKAEICTQKVPPLEDKGRGILAACHMKQREEGNPNE